MPASDSANITKRIEELGDWRGETLARVRQLIHDADPDIQEEWKWEKPKSPGTPVWSHDGGVCTGESYKQVVKLTFFRGAAIEDPKKLFNSSLEGNTRRAIDLREGERIDEAAFKQLIRAAVAANSAARARQAAKKNNPALAGLRRVAQAIAARFSRRPLQTVRRTGEMCAESQAARRERACRRSR